MLRDLIAWCLHSPRRLTLTGVAVVTAVCLTWLLSSQGASAGPGSGETEPGQSVAAPDPSAGAASTATAARSPAPEPDEPPAAWPHIRRSAGAFLHSYLATPGPHGTTIDPDLDLERWVTPALWRGLKLADPQELPAGPVDSLDEIATGAFTSEIDVTLVDAWHLTLTLVAWDDHWRVADVRRGETP